MIIVPKPGLPAGYGLHNIGFRYNGENAIGLPVTLQAIYFKNYFNPKTTPNLVYVMKRISIDFAYTSILSFKTEKFYNTNMMHFWNETKPFSLRRKTLNNFYIYELYYLVSQ